MVSISFHLPSPPLSPGDPNKVPPFPNRDRLMGGIEIVCHPTYLGFIDSVLQTGVFSFNRRAGVVFFFFFFFFFF